MTEEKKFSYPKTFLLGFGFFGVSVIWSVYNAYVPLMLTWQVRPQRRVDWVLYGAGQYCRFVDSTAAGCFL